MNFSEVTLGRRLLQHKEDQLQILRPMLGIWHIQLHTSSITFEIMAHPYQCLHYLGPHNDETKRSPEVLTSLLKTQ